MEEFKMNGPAQFFMKVWVINDETEQAGLAEVSFPPFEYPTRQKIKEKVAGVAAELEEKGMLGFRLMTKKESIKAWSIEETGQPLAVATGPHWDAI